MASNVDKRRKMWSEESMIAATNSVLHDNNGVREASRLYNVPFEMHMCNSGAQNLVTVPRGFVFL